MEGYHPLDRTGKRIPIEAYEFNCLRLRLLAYTSVRFAQITACWRHGMSQLLEQLRSCANVEQLKPLLLAICSRFGEVTRLDVLVSSQIGKRQAMCFIRMVTPEQEQCLMHELCMGRFGGDMVLIVDLHPENDKPLPSTDSGDQRSAGQAVSPRDFQPTLPIASIAAETSGNHLQNPVHYMTRS